MIRLSIHARSVTVRMKHGRQVSAYFFQTFLDDLRNVR
jgi:hypothetical protein